MPPVTALCHILKDHFLQVNSSIQGWQWIQRTIIENSLKRIPDLLSSCDFQPPAAQHKLAQVDASYPDTQEILHSKDNRNTDLPEGGRSIRAQEFPGVATTSLTITQGNLLFCELSELHDGIWSTLHSMKNMHTGYHYNHCFPWPATNQPAASRCDLILHIYFCSHMTWKTAQLLWSPLTLGRSCYYIQCFSHSVSKLMLCYCVQKTSSVSSWMLVPLTSRFLSSSSRLGPCPPLMPGLEKFCSWELKTKSIIAYQPSSPRLILPVMRYQQKPEGQGQD